MSLSKLISKALRSAFKSEKYTPPRNVVQHTDSHYQAEQKTRTGLTNPADDTGYFDENYISDWTRYKFENSTEPKEADNFKWRAYPGMNIEVAGTSHRRRGVEKFIYNAQIGEEQNISYGITLQREPENPYDANAIKVMGWNLRPDLVEHIGYIPKDVAAAFSEFSDNVPIAAILVGSHEKDDYIGVTIRTLIPGKTGGFWKDRSDCPL
jgi:hypothetical protein